MARHRIICPYCNCEASFVSGVDVYPHRFDLYGRKYWVCEPCDARVGAHPDGRPFGRLANAELRQLRMEAHGLFDPMWKKGGMSRNQAYWWLANKLGIPEREAHIGKADIETCKRIIAVWKG